MSSRRAGSTVPPSHAVLGGVEAGGTKCVCGVSSAPDGVIEDRVVFGTEDPATTLERVVGYFSQHRQLEAVGVASFGPVELDRDSAHWGSITSTPKPGWRGTDMVSWVERLYPHARVGFDTDTNAAAIAEGRWGAAQGLDTFIYLTVGTGIGGGVVVEGAPVHGLVHPEVGHMRLPHDCHADPFEGICPFHGDCLEGMASGPALRQRWGTDAGELPADHAAWDLEAHYLGAGIANLIYAVSPERVILGGGVMKRDGLIEKVRAAVLESLGGYIGPESPSGGIDDYVVAPGLGDDAGLQGALALASDALRRR